MSARTIDNCVVIKRGVRMGLGAPVRVRAVGKCIGYRNGDGWQAECLGCRFRQSLERKPKELNATHDPWTVQGTLNKIRDGKIPQIGKRFTVETEHGSVEVDIKIRKARMTWYDEGTMTLHKTYDNLSRCAGILARLGPDLGKIRSEGTK